ncbi:hypothetical protein A2276_02385 [candidate division WOR-1 bacterium RIFOXYA12_FULL_43_27]|uniref:Phosphatidylglycerol lysyltransferase C-terminal domain-containing protein n=1 Tax=candidate division WOR-1 bacterium RIFOXYC2_FULL_46_14 TaxID=1802587 RepID=A0A1F4U853_UNCSA|nr:MAG: hypothetical protein A2276_02385 [candidate division WOR-1 bacterium RIFOXYA12_FULL_43_27]OGC19441.1 MAG: hypothetical protein A2292_01945 [candidate division WOR-1 bacterium RIFOXYB2_FULL_46_45]OGC30430.1 MAG: hypothetical protein A2232_01945 [candidate division WOR-1 bacterium RIFOXYA2_FULL_46_56]OGC41030.1 MAG: hypothetical protein A2438_01945 [candidate division WOR-1 bacterium RIFOXYC2_FULL_46_14]
MIPQYPNFKELELADQAEIKKWFKKFPQTTCEMNFVNLYIWRHFDHYKLTILNDNLWIHVTPPNEAAFCYAPIGDNKIKESLEFCSNNSPRLSRVPEGFVDKYIKGNKNYKISCDPRNYDYVYLTEDLIGLKGKKFDGKRNHIKKFQKKYKYEYKQLNKNNYKECYTVLKNWEEQRKSLSDLAIKSQGDAIKNLFDKFEELGVLGGGLAIDGKIEAFSLASELNPDTADIHIEIANPKFDGIFPAINNEFAKNELGRYKFINREQDLGLSGMRKAKLSYHPHHMERKFDIIKI